MRIFQEYDFTLQHVIFDIFFFLFGKNRDYDVKRSTVTQSVGRNASHVLTVIDTKNPNAIFGFVCDISNIP